MDLKVLIVINVIIFVMPALIYCDTSVEPIGNLTRAIYRTNIILLQRNRGEVLQQLSKPELQYTVKKCYNCILAIINNAKLLCNDCIGKVHWSPPIGCTNIPKHEDLCADPLTVYVSTINANFENWLNQCGTKPQIERKTIYTSLPDIITCGNISRGNKIQALCATHWAPDEDKDDAVE